MKNVIEVLKARGFIDALTSEELVKVTEKPIKVYCGFDPTADSLHLGNLVAIMGLAWFQRFGHTPVAIMGGATAMIGDPGGKSIERPLLDEAVIEENLKGIRKNLEAVLQQGPVSPLYLNNSSWINEFSFVRFLRDVGKHFRVGAMLSKEAVKARLNSEEGISFTEFSYQAIQAYDFLHLYEKYGVSLQLGGADQWGNITAGTELIRKVLGKQAFGATFPLLVKSDGQKFGKSEKGAVWLSSEKLSPYEFYQYLVRTADADVINLMRMLTFMDMEEIREYEEMLKSSNAIPNTAQKRLAEEVTKIVHGEEALKIALKVTDAAKPGAETVLDHNTLEALGNEMPSMKFKLSEVIDVKVVDLLAITGMQTSKGEARRLIKNGGVYLNNKQVQDADVSVKASDLIGQKLILLAVGKKNKMLLRIEN